MDLEGTSVLFGKISGYSRKPHLKSQLKSPMCGYTLENPGHDSPVIGSTGCSSRGPGFDSKHQHAGLQPFVPLVPVELVPSLASMGTGHLHTDMAHTPTWR